MWHLSCYRRVTDQDHTLDFDEGQSSGSEYVPDSNDDSDSSMPLEPPQSEVQPCEGTPALPSNYPSNSLGACTPDEAGSSRCLPLSAEHTDVTAAETSNSVVSTKDSSPEQMKNKHKRNLPHLSLTTRNYCFVCGKPQSRLTRHLKVHVSPRSFLCILSPRTLTGAQGVI